MGDAARDRLSDRGSIPLRSTYYAESELIEFGFFALITMNDGESVFRLCRKEIFKQALASSALNNHQFR